MRRSDIEEIEALLDDDPREALSLASRIVDETPDDPDGWAWRAEAQIALGQAENALKSLAEYVQRDPEWIEAYTMRAVLLTELARFDDAHVEVEVARAIDSEDPRLQRAEAVWHELQGHFPEADKLYALAAEGDPGLYPAPPRFDRPRAQAAILKVLREIAKDGLKLQPLFQEVPTPGPTKGGKLLTRALELRDKSTVVVYLRNLERELDDESQIEDLAEVFEDCLAELVEAN